MAKKKNLGALYVSMGADTRDFRSKMAGARNDIKKTTKSFTAFKGAIVGAFATLGGAAVVRSVRNINMMTKELAEYGAQLSRRADLIGISSEELQYHQRALDALGGSEETFTKLVLKSTQAFVDYAAGLTTITDAFKVLGIRQKEVEASSGSVTAQLNLLLTKFAALDKVDKATAIGLSSKVFGARVGKEVLPFAGGFQDELARARAQGGAIKDADVAALDRLNHELDVFNQKIKNLKAEFVAENADELFELQKSWHEALLKMIPTLKILADLGAQAAVGIAGVVKGYQNAAEYERQVQIVQQAHPPGSPKTQFPPAMQATDADRARLAQLYPSAQFLYDAKTFALQSGMQLPDIHMRRTSLAERQAGAAPFTLDEPDRKAVAEFREAILESYREHLRYNPDLTEYGHTRNRQRANASATAPGSGVDVEGLIETDPGAAINQAALRAAVLATDRAGIARYLASAEQGATLSPARRLALTGASEGEIAAASTRESLDSYFKGLLKSLQGQADTANARYVNLQEAGDFENAGKVADDLDHIRDRIRGVNAEWMTAKENVYPGILESVKAVADEESRLLQQQEAHQEALLARAAIISEISHTLAGGITSIFSSLADGAEGAEEAIKQLGRTLVETLTQRLITDQLAAGLSSLIGAGINGFLAAPAAGAASGTGYISPGAGRLHAAQATNIYNTFNGVSGPGVRQAINAEVPGIVSTTTAHITSLQQDPTTALGKTGYRRL